MRTAFEQKSLETAIQRLLDDGFIKTEEQKKKLIDVYSKDPREYRIIHEEINKLRFDKQLLEKVLKKDELIAGKDANDINTEKKVEYALSLENITDFEKDGKNYIKIHYPYPYDNVRIIENRTDPYQSGKERFEELQGTQKVMSTDGVSNATSIFEETLVRDCHEVNVRNIKDVSSPQEFSKLSQDERERVVGTIRSILASLPLPEEEKRRLNGKSVDMMLSEINKKVYISPEDNVVVICEPNNPFKDEVKTLNVEKTQTLDGRVKTNYTLKPVNEVGYQYDSSEEELEQSNTETEIQNESDIDKEMGTSYKKVPPKRKKDKNTEAAFISVFWFVLFMGIISAIILFSIFNMTIKW